MSASGRSYLKGLEGRRLIPYRDGDGYSIGDGHFILPGEEWMLSGITDAEADLLFENDLDAATEAVNDTITDYPAAEFWDALIMFAYNIGPDNFRSSQLARMVNDFPNTTDQEIYNFWLTTWVGSPAKPALLTRRMKEADYAYGLPDSGNIDYTFEVNKPKTNYWWLLIPAVGLVLYSKS